MTPSLVTNNISWNGEAIHEEVLRRLQSIVSKATEEKTVIYLSILDRRFKKLLEVFMSLLVLVALFPPFSNKLSMED